LEKNPFEKIAEKIIGEILENLKNLKNEKILENLKNEENSKIEKKFELKKFENFLNFFVELNSEIKFAFGEKQTKSKKNYIRNEDLIMKEEYGKYFFLKYRKIQ